MLTQEVIDQTDYLLLLGRLRLVESNRKQKIRIDKLTADGFLRIRDTNYFVNIRGIVKNTIGREMKAKPDGEIAILGQDKKRIYITAASVVFEIFGVSAYTDEGFKAIPNSNYMANSEGVIKNQFGKVLKSTRANGGMYIRTLTNEKKWVVPADIAKALFGETS